VPVDYDKTLAEVRDYFAARLGDDVADQLVDLARPGFILEEAAPGDATGHCRFGGRALLEPGTPWPMCEDLPLSLLAVLDANELAPWLRKELPAGIGYLNFFHLDGYSDHHDPRGFELTCELSPNDPRLGMVICARADRAEEAAPPAHSTVFEPMPWRAAPGVGLPDLEWDPVVQRIDLGPDVDEIDQSWPGSFIERSIHDWAELPARIDSEDGDVAFGWAAFPTSNLWSLPPGEDPNDYHHLLQLTGNDQWRIDGEGGWTHYSIPTRALRTGDFTKAIPTPQLW
jgi:hypothetical protein